ncbi:biopolymer transporter ExbD [Corticibacter populi]|uniref:Biopolymer transporter ExbD n=1 Tax=Corticibacter populi TaxID=1550736 RepID=A0A3M6QNI6_9BURK|nr:biopolymer transporter ExbD [Corticibacter populi]RZS33096.1 biopolymer transport protein ExbD [Corticibacter populi]
MAFSNLEQDSDDVMSEINMVPLIDIMLVLLIIFIITVPVIKHAMNVELPQASTEPEKVEPETVSLSIDAEGIYYLDTTPVTDDELKTRLALESAKDPQPSLHISGDKNVRYERVAKAMALASETGLSKIGFITEPDGGGASGEALDGAGNAATGAGAHDRGERRGGGNRRGGRGDGGEGEELRHERRGAPMPSPGGA